MKKLRQITDIMLEIGERDKNLVVITGYGGILKPFPEQYPRRYYNIGL